MRPSHDRSRRAGDTGQARQCLTTEFVRFAHCLAAGIDAGTVWVNTWGEMTTRGELVESSSGSRISGPGRRDMILDAVRVLGGTVLADDDADRDQEHPGPLPGAGRLAEEHPAEQADLGQHRVVDD